MGGRFYMQSDKNIRVSNFRYTHSRNNTFTSGGEIVQTRKRHHAPRVGSFGKGAGSTCICIFIRTQKEQALPSVIIYRFHWNYWKVSYTWPPHGRPWSGVGCVPLVTGQAGAAADTLSFLGGNISLWPYLSLNDSRWPVLVKIYVTQIRTDTCAFPFFNLEM